MPKAARQPAPESPSIAIVGGSVAGLCVGVALRAIGYDVNIHEQAEGPMRDHGAGIVVQPELIDLLPRHDANEFATTGARRRLWGGLCRQFNASVDFIPRHVHMALAVAGHKPEFGQPLDVGVNVFVIAPQFTG